jgi:integrase
MPRLKLTQAAVDRLKAPPEGRVEYWDTVLPGFGLRVSPARPGQPARKVWQCMYRVQGRQVREQLGALAAVPKIERARELARASMQKAQQGIHPIVERRRADQQERRQAEAESARRRDTLGAVLDRYLAEYGSRRWRHAYLKEVTRSFGADLLALRDRPIGEIARRDLRELLDGIVSRGRAPHAHHVLAYLRPALAWAVAREIVTVNPADGIPDPDPRRREARTRDRYLDENEIRLFWQACERIGWPFGPLFRLLLLTAQRRDELAEARRHEFDLDKALWTLPRERSKNEKEHLVHLSEPTIEILRGLPQLEGENFLFTTNGATPVSGFGRARERLAAAMLELRQAEAGRGVAPAIEPFTLHDLRRTAATGMAGIGIAHEVVDRILNHTEGKISGVARIYNRFAYLGERKAAFEAWGRHVESLSRPMPSNVVALRSQ